MSNHISTPFTSIQSEELNKSGKYPYLVIRLMSAVYQRERLEIFCGEPSAAIRPGKCYVQHPDPIAPDGMLTPGCRTLLLNTVKEAVSRTRFRMSVIWGEGDVSYVEHDGSIKASSVIPSGGIQLPNKLAFNQRVVTDFPKDSGEAK